MKSACSLESLVEVAMPDVALRCCCLVTDGNSHRPDLCLLTMDFTHGDVLCESMLPEIRTVALLIAAQRHDFSACSPRIFADEADWFAARIVVLQARAFCLDVRLNDMLCVANERAKTFAVQHHLPFQAASIHASLHHKRAANMWLMECELAGDALCDVFANSRTVRKQIEYRISGCLKCL